MRDSVFYTRRVLRILRCTRCVTVPRPDQSLHRRVCPSIRGVREREGISEQWCDESRKMQCVNQSRSRADCLAAAPLTHIVSPILIPHYPVIFRAGDTFTNHPVLLSYSLLLSGSSSRGVLGCRPSGLKCPPISVFFVGGVDLFIL